jgi:hypothetical protein
MSAAHCYRGGGVEWRPSVLDRNRLLSQRERVVVVGQK